MKNSPRVAVVGDGAMGTVCAIILARKGYEVGLWGAFPENARQTNDCRENRTYLPGFALPEQLLVSADAEQVLPGAQIVVSAVPCQYMRKVWENLADCLAEEAVVVSVTKGVEMETLKRPCEILAELTGDDRRLAALSGPTIAGELAAGLPATAVVASDCSRLAQLSQEIFTTESFRVYTNPDLVGVELAGASKNVIALAAGIIDGLGLGNNAKAALLTRGLVEITRLGLAMGAREETFAGLAGLGDLVTTCISPQGRNRSVGEQIGKGLSLKDILAGMSAVAEGVTTTESLMALARKHDIDMPITAKVQAVLFQGQSPQQAISELMSRTPKPER